MKTKLLTISAVALLVVTACSGALDTGTTATPSAVPNMDSPNVISSPTPLATTQAPPQQTPVPTSEEADGSPSASQPTQQGTTGDQGATPEAAQPPSPAPTTTPTLEPNVSSVSNLLDAPAPSRLPEFDRSKFYQLLPQDAIRPIYEPQFTGARGAKLFDDDLILGVEINGEAKAYPISVMRFREIVNDELGGVPILVTW
ncbi:MAG: DUF3179 domain-containing protein [Chloroflexi bacterium]|nr:DUF3179 domain-containing protein [Chloroflexota bacterium]